MDGTTILVVEDNPNTRKFMRVTLELEGFRVLECADARAAVASAERGHPDLVLQDIVLPDMSGFELVRQLRALPGGGQVPIIAMTGLLSRFDDAQLSTAAFNEILIK